MLPLIGALLACAAGADQRCAGSGNGGSSGSSSSSGSGSSILAHNSDAHLFEPVPGNSSSSSSSSSLAPCDGGRRTGVAFALGIVSAPQNGALRDTIRRTWLRPTALPAPLRGSFVHRFFIGTTDDGDGDGDGDGDASVTDAVRAEAARHGDIVVIGARDTYANVVYKAIGIMRWGTRRCGAHFVARANDDVYLRLGPLLHSLYQRAPVATYAGRMVPAGLVTVLRPDAFSPAARARLSPHVRAQLVSYADYPSSAYPRFAQGNAYVLSRDLADAVAAIGDQPHRKLLADDILVGLEVASRLGRGAALCGTSGAAAAGNASDPAACAYVDWRVDFLFDVKRTPCTNEAQHHFNVDGRAMEALRDNERAGRAPCDGIASLLPFARRERTRDETDSDEAYA